MLTLGMKVAITDPREWARWTRRLAPSARADVARKLLAVAAQWPVGLPLMRTLGGNLFEVRCGRGLRVYLTEAGGKLYVLTAGRKDTEATGNRTRPRKDAMTERLTLTDWIEHERADDPEFREVFDAGAQRDALVRALVDARKRLGITQQELAKRTGMTASALSRMEAGAVDPRWSTIARVSHALGARIELMIDHEPLAG